MKRLTYSATVVATGVSAVQLRSNEGNSINQASETRSRNKLPAAADVALVADAVADALTTTGTEKLAVVKEGSLNSVYRSFDYLILLQCNATVRVKYLFKLRLIITYFLLLVDINYDQIPTSLESLNSDTRTPPQFKIMNVKK
jgi:hypothetical protein